MAAKQRELEFSQLREQMVENQLRRRGVRDEKVLAAMKKVPREEFVGADIKNLAYDNRPLPIGLHQTISQPFIVAYMIEALELTPASRVLEIGTGCGYNAAVMSLIAAEVYTIEILEPLAKEAQKRFKKLNYQNIHARIGDAFGGWPDRAPFDAIILTAAPPEIPEPLIEQLAEGGVLVAPEGREHQILVRLQKTKSGIKRTEMVPVSFVPMTGTAIDI